MAQYAPLLRPTALQFLPDRPADKPLPPPAPICDRFHRPVTEWPVMLSGQVNPRQIGAPMNRRHGTGDIYGITGNGRCCRDGVRDHEYSSQSRDPRSGQGGSAIVISGSRVTGVLYSRHRRFDGRMALVFGLAVLAARQLGHALTFKPAA